MNPTRTPARAVLALLLSVTAFSAVAAEAASPVYVFRFSAPGAAPVVVTPPPPPPLPAGYLTHGGLLWMLPADVGDYDVADAYCKSGTFAGKAGWRLPTLGELVSFMTNKRAEALAAGWGPAFYHTSTYSGQGGHYAVTTTDASYIPMPSGYWINFTCVRMAP